MEAVLANQGHQIREALRIEAVLAGSNEHSRQTLISYAHAPLFLALASKSPNHVVNPQYCVCQAYARSSQLNGMIRPKKLMQFAT
eukprot:scaffold77906_cov18-Tisochrysis_lutea.AAC.1